MKRAVCLIAVILILCTGVAFAGNPSGWVAEEVKNAINAGYVPEEIQADYTAPIKRGEFALMELGVSEETAYEDSCKIEHDISVESFEIIKNYLAKCAEKKREAND